MQRQYPSLQGLHQKSILPSLLISSSIPIRSFETAEFYFKASIAFSALSAFPHSAPCNAEPFWMVCNGYIYSYPLSFLPHWQVLQMCDFKSLHSLNLLRSAFMSASSMSLEGHCSGAASLSPLSSLEDFRPGTYWSPEYVVDVFLVFLPPSFCCPFPWICRIHLS